MELSEEFEAKIQTQYYLISRRWAYFAQHQFVLILDAEIHSKQAVSLTVGQFVFHVLRALTQTECLQVYFAHIDLLHEGSYIYYQIYIHHLKFFIHVTYQKENMTFSRNLDRRRTFA